MANISTPAWKLKAIDGATVTVGRIFKYGAWVLIARYGYLSIVVLAGKQTIAQLGIKILANITVSRAIYLTAAMGGVGYGAAQKHLRKRTIRSRARRIKELEEKIDPNRSSSRLMQDGSTRPEDEEI